MYIEIRNTSTDTLYIPLHTSSWGVPVSGFPLSVRTLNYIVIRNTFLFTRQAEEGYLSGLVEHYEQRA